MITEVIEEIFFEIQKNIFTRFFFIILYKENHINTKIKKKQNNFTKKNYKGKKEKMETDLRHWIIRAEIRCAVDLPPSKYQSEFSKLPSTFVGKRKLKNIRNWMDYLQRKGP